MNFSELISNINWLAVIVLTIFSFVIGFLWHRPFMFGKTWEKENNFDNSKINAPKIFGVSAVMHFIAIAGLGAVASGLGAKDGAHVGLLIALIWVLPAMAGIYLFANRSMKLLAIDAGMYAVLYAICGMILGVW